MTDFPRLTPLSQFDGGTLQASNCTMASMARLLRYATGKVTTGSKLRACQSDQTAGTSIPDAIRATVRCHSWKPSWAARDDGPRPAGRIGESVGWDDVLSFLDEGYIVLVQLVYEVLPGQYRYQKVPEVGGHALCLDGRTTGWVYAVDPIPRAGSGYDGDWIPEAAMRAAVGSMAGFGRAFAAWARPPLPPDTGASEGADSMWIGDTPAYSVLTAARPYFDDTGRQLGTLAKGQRIELLGSGVKAGQRDADWVYVAQLDANLRRIVPEGGGIARRMRRADTAPEAWKPLPTDAEWRTWYAKAPK